MCFTISIVLSSLSLKSQDLQGMADFARQQYKAENYKNAIQEYNRALFFGYTPRDGLLLELADSYFNLKDYEQSIIHYDKAYFSTSSDSLKNEAILGKSFSLIMQQQWMLALSEIMNLDTALCSQQTARASFYQGIACFGMHEDKMAETAFKNCLLQLHDSVSGAGIEEMFASIRKNEKRFNPNVARVFSLLLPGSGQLYAKEYLDALNSAALVGGLIYLMVNFASKVSIMESLFVVMPWVQRYYFGGTYKAAMLTGNRREEFRYARYSKIVETIESAGGDKWK